jgi:hypothetical protein
LWALSILDAGPLLVAGALAGAVLAMIVYDHAISMLMGVVNGHVAAHVNGRVLDRHLLMFVHSRNHRAAIDMKRMRVMVMATWFGRCLLVFVAGDNGDGHAMLAMLHGNNLPVDDMGSILLDALGCLKLGGSARKKQSQAQKNDATE